MYKVRLEYYIPSQNKVDAEILSFSKYDKLEKFMIAMGKYLESYDKEYQLVHIDIDAHNKISISSIHGTTGTVISYRVDDGKEWVWRHAIFNLPDYFGSHMSGDLHVCII